MGGETVFVVISWMWSYCSLLNSPEGSWSTDLIPMKTPKEPGYGLL